MLCVPSKQPDGLDDANVALVTRSTAQPVTYVRLSIDQLCGFSMSPGAKSM